MNRKAKEKENPSSDAQLKPGQPIPPKFAANWILNVHFDKIIINLSDCQYDVLTRVAKQLKFKIKNDPESAQWDVWWTDWHVLPQTLLKMEQHQKINHFPGMFNLSRKNLLAKNLMRMKKKSSDDYNFFPLTWNLPMDYNQLKAYHDSKPKGKTRTYIIKPQSLSQGRGIFLTKRIQDIPLDQKYVVQRYLSKPYLIDGLKFDLRIYVLVAGVDPLKLFVYHQGLARFATQTYSPPNKDNITEACMHLTNYAINKQNDKFIFNEDDTDMTKGHKRSLTSIFTYLQQKGVNIAQLKTRINQIIVKTMISGLSQLRFQYRSNQKDNYRSDMCFQILGFDILLNQNLQPFVLQINYTPSFSTDTPLDQNIKKNLIKDTLILMEINKQFKTKIINQRKQYRNMRILTGKTNKITNEERKQKIKLAEQQRDAYIANHMGGFIKIYPLQQNTPQNTVLMQKYNYLITIQDDITDKRKQPKNPKLPILPSHKQQSKKKTQTSCKVIQSKYHKQAGYPKTSKNKSKNQNNQKRSQSSYAITDQTFNNNNNLKEYAINKKKGLQRQTLTLKSIQFQGARFDGFSQNYKANVLLNQKRYQ